MKDKDISEVLVGVGWLDDLIDDPNGSYEND